MAKFKVTAERDEAGWWVATAHGIQGVHTQAKTLATLRSRMLEALDAAGEPNAEIELDLRPAKANG
jgi:predicted RNase H-like HicB family nuclease